MNNDKVRKAVYITNTFYYTCAPLVRAALIFLTLPIMTRFLSPADYGIISLLTMISTFGWMFCLGINDASYRFYFKYQDDISKLRRLFSTNLIFIVSSLLFYCVLLCAFFPYLNNYFFKGQLKMVWAVFALCSFSLVYINTMNQDILRVKHEGKKWFLNELMASLIMVILAVVLAATKRFTFEALIIANLVAELVKCGLIYAQLYGYYGFIFDFSRLKESLIYVWPQTPSSLIGFVYSYIDKILLSRFRGLSQIGILDISGRISLVLKMNMDGIAGVFSPVTLELMTENSRDSLKRLADICLKVVFFILLLSLTLILFSKELIYCLTTKEYHFAVYVAPVYIYYHVFGVLGMVSYWLIYYQPQKTFWRIPINIIGLISNTVANIILIPRYGVMGAALAIFFSAALTGSTQLIIGLKITPIPINIFKFSMMFMLLFLETAGLYLLYYLNLNLTLSIVIKVAMLLVFLLFGFIQKTFVIGEIKEIITIFRDKVKNNILTRAAFEKHTAD